MAVVPNPMESLGISPELLAVRPFRFLETTDRSIIWTIKRGVVYVMAFWSGPARKSFSELKRVLAALDPAGRLELVVVDTDSCPDFYEMPEFTRGLGGWGETAWIRDGKVVDVGYGAADYEAKISALLADEDLS